MPTHHRAYPFKRGKTKLQQRLPAHALIACLIGFGLIAGFAAVRAFAAYTGAAHSFDQQKGAFIDEALGAQRGALYNWLLSHEKDDYYLGTRYDQDSWGSEYWRLARPHGDNGNRASANGSTEGMQCSGFVAHAVGKVLGLDVRTQGIPQLQDSARAGGGAIVSLYGADAKYNWVDSQTWAGYAATNGCSYYSFSSKQDLLNSGLARKGDIIVMLPSVKTQTAGKDDFGNPTDAHIGFFWGDTPSQDRFWHSTHQLNGAFANDIQGGFNQITKIIPKTNDNDVYVLLPISHPAMTVAIQKAFHGIEKVSLSASGTSGVEYGLWNNDQCAGAPLAVCTLVDTNNDYHHATGVFRNAAGVADFTSAPGTYFVKETKTIAGYQLDPTIHYVKIDTYGQVLVNHNDAAKTPAERRDNDSEYYGQKSYLYNWPEDDSLCEIEVKKVDENGKALGGAVFALYTSEADAKSKTNALSHTTCEPNGIGRFYNLDPGSYFIREKHTPDGYILDDQIVKVTLEAGKTTRAKAVYNDPAKLEASAGGAWVNESQPTSGKIKVTKISANPDLSNNNERYSFAGTEFGIYQDQACTKLIQTLTLGAGQDAVVSKDLDEGSYWVKETKAAQAYLINTSSNPVEVVANKTADISIVNQPKPTSLSLAKRSTKAEQVKDNACYSLAGAQYQVYLDEACSKEAKDSSRKSAQLITGKDGNSNALTLEPGTYWVKETKASQGYRLDKKVQKVQLASESVTITSEEVPSIDKIVLKIQKKDAVSGKGEAQSGTSLQGARFSLNYWDNTDNKTDSSPSKTWTLETDKSGLALLSDELLIGSYQLKEIEPPQGYQLNETHYSFRVLANSDGSTRLDGECLDSLDENAHEASIHVAETPSYGRVAIQKLDRDRKDANSGDASREGIKFELINTTASSIYVNKKEIKNGASIFVGVTNKDGYLACPYDLPLGTYQWRELETNKGYLNDSQPVSLNVVSGKTTTVTATDTVKKGGLAVVKRDAQLKRGEAQGDLSLAGAVIDIFNASKDSVVVDGKVFAPEERVLSITTDASGRAATKNELLPYGTYKLSEQKAPTGYDVNTSWKPVVQIRENGQIVEIEHALDESPCVYGSISVLKQSDETHTQQLTGDQLDWSNFVFQLVNRSAHPIVYQGKEIGVGGVVDILTTNKEGAASLPQESLVAGTYELTELSCPESFIPNPHWKESFSVSSDAADTEKVFSFTCEDAPERENFRFVKAAEDTGERLASVFWLVSSNSTGESHIIKTDANGIFDSANLRAHSSMTNHNDLVISPTDMQKLAALATSKAGRDNRLTLEELNDIVGAVKLDESQYRDDAGLWFFGNAELEGDVFDERASMVHDSYTVQELPCLANAGYDYELARFELVTTNNSTTSIDLGTVSDRANPLLRTKALGPDGQHIIPSLGEASISDTVSFANVHAGEPYRLEGELHATDGVRDLGLLAKSTSHEFIAQGSSGTEIIEFKIDAAELAGTKTVVFEKLYQSGRLIAEHADPGDSFQSVEVPLIKTSLSDEQKNHEVKARERIELYDRVSYQNLTPGLEYNISGVLIDKETGEAYCDIDGHEVVSSQMFTPTEPQGSIDVRFSFQAPQERGVSLVAFEKLLFKQREYAVHADINDKEQSVTIPYISTTAQAKDASKIVPRGTNVLVEDVVHYENLQPGSPYTLVATPHLVSQKGEDEGACGAPLAQSFVAHESGTGNVRVSYELDTTKLAGRKLVFFEDCLTGKLDAPDGSWDIALGKNDGSGRLIAQHADILDDKQSLYVPSISTTAHDKVDQDKALTEGNAVTIVDKVTYHQLEPNKQYRLHGKLMDKASNKELLIDGKPVVAEKEFVPKTADGIVELEFSFDARGLGRHDLVAFETLSSQGIDYAVHADINDENQSVHVNELSYELKKYRVSSAPEKKQDTDKGYGFYHGDEVSYHIELINTGEDTIFATLTDSFEDILSLDTKNDYASLFEDLRYTEVLGEGVSWLNETESRGSSTVSPTLRVEAQSTATLVVCARISESAPEYLADTALDDGVEQAGSGRNWTDTNNGRTENINPHDGYINSASASEVTGPHGEKLEAKTDTANTPVQSNPSYDMRKYRVSEAPEKSGFDLYGFSQGETIEYAIEVLNTGDTGITVDVEDSFSDEFGFGDQEDYHAFFEKPVWTRVEGEGVDWLNESETMGTSKPASIALRPGATATLYLNSTPTIEACELLAPAPFDDAVERAGQGRAWTDSFEGRTTNSNTGDGYINTASVYNVIAEDGSVLPPKYDTANTPIQQTPTIKTTLTDGRGSHQILAGQATLVDTIAYDKLVAGQSYIIKGKLVDKASGQALNASGATREFVANETSGFVEVSFIIDAHELADCDIVAFEELYVVSKKPTQADSDESHEANSTLIAEHKDINDTEQTVHVVPVTPITRIVDKVITSTKKLRAMPKTGSFAFGIVPIAVGLILISSTFIKHRKDKRLS